MVHPALMDPTPTAAASAAAGATTWSNTVATVPFGGFELLREPRSEKGFKGEDMQGSDQMFVDFLTFAHRQRVDPTLA